MNRLTVDEVLEMYKETLLTSVEAINRRDALMFISRFISFEDDEEDDEEDEENDEMLDLVEKALLHDPDPEVRRYAAWVLHEKFNPRIRRMLLNALKDEDQTVRFEAVEALASLDSSFEQYVDLKVITELFPALGDKCLDVRMRAVFHLSFFAGEDIRGVIREMFPDWADTYRI